MIPEPHDLKALSRDECIARRVAHNLIGMLSAIDLHHKTTFEADEIRDERPDEMLSAELQSSETSIPHFVPKT